MSASQSGLPNAGCQRASTGTPEPMSTLPLRLLWLELSGSILLGPLPFNRKPQAHACAIILAADARLRLANLTVPHAKPDEDAALSP